MSSTRHRTLLSEMRNLTCKNDTEPTMKNCLCNIVLGAVVALAAVCPNKAQAQTNIVAEYARNVRDYGAKGDGVADDTQAFIQALQSGRHQSGLTPSPQTIYVPPGQYLISSTLIIWANTTFVGEWTNPPTLILAPNSPGFQDATNPQPFLVTAGGYNVPDNTTDWLTRTANFNQSSNNTFSIHVRDLIVSIGSGNPGAIGIYWWCAQNTSLRNVTFNAGSAYGCVYLGAWGGVSTIANCSLVGGNQGLIATGTSEEFIRNCTFTAQSQNAIVLYNGLTNFTFLDDGFQNTGPIYIGATDAYHPAGIAMINCSFANMPNGTFTQEPMAALLHFEHVTFDAVSAVPAFLHSVVQNGVVTQWTGSNTPSAFIPTVGKNNLPVYYNKQWIAGTNSLLNKDIFPGTWQTPTFPRPDSTCVNIKDLGAAGDGVTDDTQVILNALASYNEIYFPNGTYVISEPITINAGQELFGEANSILATAPDAPAFAYGTYASVVTVQGNGTGKGVVLNGISIDDQAPGGLAVTWTADPSSVMMDCPLINATSFSPLPVLDIQQGGGILENLWIVGNLYIPEGVSVQSQGPTYCYQISAEHYQSYSLVVESAANLLLINWEGEYGGDTSVAGVNAQIMGSSKIYAYGLFGDAPPGTWPYPLLQLSRNSQLRIWDVEEFNLPNLLEDCTNQPCLELGSLGSQVANVPGEILCGYIKD